MKVEKIVKYDEIGEVSYRKNPKARNLSIRISRNGSVSVTQPKFCSFNQAEGFVLKKGAWIQTKLKEIEARKEEKLSWKAGDQIALFKGNVYFHEGSGSCNTFEYTDENVHVFLAAAYNPSKEKDQDALFAMLGCIGYEVAKKELPDILYRCSERYGLPYNRLTVRKMRTRWGSCSSRNNINLSSGLVFLDADLIEYVCLHELAHTVHKDHSSRFWAFLEDLLPEAKERRKRLRKHEIIA